MQLGFPYAGRSRFAGPSPYASGRPSGNAPAVTAKAEQMSGSECHALVTRPRRAEQYLPKEDATP